MATICELFRYPIKGFPGEQLEAVSLRKGEGIPGDRCIALGSGAMPIANDGAWTACQAFQRMTIRPDLTTFELSNSAEGVLLSSTDGRAQLVHTETSDLGDLSELFGNQTSINRASGNRGYWDHQDAAISIINVSTVEAIARIVGREIDPRRFRANVYVRAEAWSEFQWVGQSLDIGVALLDVVRPIDRCKTTSVDVGTGELNLNIPALLIRHFGHMFCGVYATVREPGTVAIADKLAVADLVPDDQLAAAAEISTAPELQSWPRRATVIRTKDEAQHIRSFWLQDRLRGIASLDRFKPGQYIRVHDLTGDHAWRSYTVSGVHDGKIRITVKRDSGPGSQAMHQLVADENITITGPFGEATLNNTSQSIYLMSAGIGITPTASKLTALAQQGYTNAIRVTHVARTRAELALWDDIVAAANELPKVQLALHLTQEQRSVDGAELGRPDLLTWAKSAKEDNADIHLCGPSGFEDTVMAALHQEGVQDSKIFVDTFSSPGIETDMRAIPHTAPIKVTLLRSGVSDYWTPEDGTLLDFAEAHGAMVPSHCRAGLCKTCRCAIVGGSATRLVGAEGEDMAETLLCSSVPRNPLTLDI